MQPVAPILIKSPFRLPALGVQGYVAVDPKTLQSTKYPNIFSLGDCR